jgi:hypothetical protein
MAGTMATRVEVSIVAIYSLPPVVIAISDNIRAKLANSTSSPTKDLSTSHYLHCV